MWTKPRLPLRSRPLAKPDPLRTKRQGIEFGIAIIGIFSFMTLQEPHRGVGQRRGGCFISRFGQPLHADGQEKGARGNGPPKREGYEKKGVESLPHQGGGDGPGPQPPSLCCHFHFGHNVRIEKFTHQISGE